MESVAPINRILKFPLTQLEISWISMWVCLKMSCTPKPNGFADHYPVFKWLFHWGYTQHFQTNPYIYIYKCDIWVCKKYGTPKFNCLSWFIICRFETWGPYRKPIPGSAKTATSCARAPPPPWRRRICARARRGTGPRRCGAWCGPRRWLSLGHGETCGIFHGFFGQIYQRVIGILYHILSWIIYIIWYNMIVGVTIILRGTIIVITVSINMYIYICYIYNMYI